MGGGRKLRYVGQARNRLWLEFATAAYNLIRMAKLDLAPAWAQCARRPPRRVRKRRDGPSNELSDSHRGRPALASPSQIWIRVFVTSGENVSRSIQST